jgi:hypothetical protein
MSKNVIFRRFVKLAERQIFRARKFVLEFLDLAKFLAKLEKAGRFPKRVQLGLNRVEWVESEVIDWLEQSLARRE